MNIWPCALLQLVARLRAESPVVAAHRSAESAGEQLRRRRRRRRRRQRLAVKVEKQSIKNVISDRRIKIQSSLVASATKASADLNKLGPALGQRRARLPCAPAGHFGSTFDATRRSPPIDQSIFVPIVHTRIQKRPAPTGIVNAGTASTGRRERLASHDHADVSAYTPGSGRTRTRTRRRTQTRARARAQARARPCRQVGRCRHMHPARTSKTSRRRFVSRH